MVGEEAVSMSDRRIFFAKLHADESLPSNLGVIVNVQGITNTPTVEEVEVIGRFVGQMLARLKGTLAIVNTRTGHVTISHIVAMLAGEDSDRVRVCMNEDIALAWIKS